ncbi:MAG: DNA-binding response regulator [Anaerohalosphaeraceae bacterium]|nr:DNA-binding response regulator [Anaerohalosphaeraceae bacterium]
MTLHKALVVDDDSNIIDVVADVLDSMGHDHDTAAHQAEARKFLATGRYSYVLLDLEIPARGWHSRPRIQNSVNLVEQIRDSSGDVKIPIILMSDRTAETSDIAVEMMRLAVDLSLRDAVYFVPKPFEITGRTLDRVIKRAIGENGHATSPAKQRNTMLKTKTTAVPDISVNASPVKADGEASLDAGNEAAPPAGKNANILTKEQRDILEAVAQNPREAMLQVEIVVAGGYSKHVTRQCLEALRKHGLVHRPHGPRKGDAVTEKGLAILGGKVWQCD